MAVNVSWIPQLSSFCKKLKDDISTQQMEAQGDSEKEIVLGVYLEKCVSICSELDKLDLSNSDDSKLKKYLQTITQLVLDLTFVDECSLVDDEFSQDSSYTSVKQIIEALHGVEALAKSVSKTNSCLEVLGPDMVECLHWRRGALLYMYCHTLNSKCSSSSQSLPSHFTQCLEDGVRYLIAMLGTRSTPKWLSQFTSSNVPPEDPDEDSDETSQLIAQGIMSDTHLLALMYCGEMCYWHAQTDHKAMAKSKGAEISNQLPAGARAVISERENCDTKNAAGANADNRDECDKSQTEISKTLDNSGNTCDSDSGDRVGIVGGKAKLDLVRIGQSSLQTYISAATGPMIAGGWNTTRAEELLQFFSSLKS